MQVLIIRDVAEDVDGKYLKYRNKKLITYYKVTFSSGFIKITIVESIFLKEYNYFIKRTKNNNY